MSDALQVALLNPTFWPEVRRGTERLIRDLADGLIGHGVRPRLIVGHPGRASTITEDGLPVIRTRRAGNRFASWFGLHERLSHAPFQYRALGAGADDLAHAFYVTDANVAAQWSRRRNRPCVFSVMGVPRPEQIASHRGRRELWRRAIDGCAAVLALSAAAAKPLEAIGVTPHVIYPGVDLETFRPTRDRSPEPTIICASDAADPRKRVDLLIEAHRLVREVVPEARLVLSKPRDQSVARRLTDGRSGVELVNLDRTDDLAREYSGAWVTVLPAEGEAFGLVAAESLACGTPAVGAEDGGVAEILGGEPVGRLFEADAAALAEAIRETLELAQSDGTRERCRARAEWFSIKRCVNEHLELYRRLVAG